MPRRTTFTVFSSLESTNILTLQSPLQKPKSYHVPNSPTTLLFIAYTAPLTITPTATFQTLVTALRSIFHSTISNPGDGLIFTETVSWSYGGAIATVENHGDSRTGQLTWGMLADTMYVYFGIVLPGFLPSSESPGNIWEVNSLSTPEPVSYLP